MFNRKGQNVLEYSILIALVVGAAIAMQTYVKRGLQGRVKNAVDHVGSANTVAGTSLDFTAEQYEPYYTDSVADITSNSAKNQAYQPNGVMNNNGINEITQKLSGSYDRSNYAGADPAKN